MMHNRASPTRKWRKLLAPTCHRRVHSDVPDVDWPSPIRGDLRDEVKANSLRNRMRAVADAKLCLSLLEVAAHRLLTQSKKGGDFAYALAGGKQPQDGDLARRKRCAFP